MIIDLKTKYSDCQARLKWGRYHNGHIALQLVDAEDGMPILTATVNSDQWDLKKGEVLIKDYSENEGVFGCLIEAGIIEDTCRRVPLSKYVEVPVARLLVEPEITH